MIPMTGSIAALICGRKNSQPVLSKEDMEEAARKAIRKEIDHQKTLEAKAWVKKARAERQRAETQMFWEWFNQEKKEENEDD